MEICMLHQILFRRLFKNSLQSNSKYFLWQLLHSTPSWVDSNIDSIKKDYKYKVFFLPNAKKACTLWSLHAVSLAANRQFSGQILARSSSSSGIWIGNRFCSKRISISFVSSLMLVSLETNQPRIDFLIDLVMTKASGFKSSKSLRSKIFEQKVWQLP